MTDDFSISALVVTTSLLLVSVLGSPQPSSSRKTDTQEVRLTRRASGLFDVKVTPETLSDKSADASLGRMSITKQFHGDLEATSKGEMLTVSTSVKGSAVYVAVERVTGVLQGRKGSFSLHHTGIMNRGNPDLKITVVPDSGTEQLVGLTGTMAVKVDNGKHSYEFDYSLPESP